MYILHLMKKTPHKPVSVSFQTTKLNFTIHTMKKAIAAKTILFNAGIIKTL